MHFKVEENIAQIDGGVLLLGHQGCKPFLVLTGDIRVQLHWPKSSAFVPGSEVNRDDIWAAVSRWWNVVGLFLLYFQMQI